MNDDRDLHLAGEITRSTPPDHGPAFWTDLESSLAAATPSNLRPLRPWRGPRVLGVAAASLLLAGSVTVALLARSGDGATDLDTGPAGVTGGPASTSTTADPEASGASTTSPSTTTTIGGEVIDLTGSQEIGTSLDGSLHLFAWPDPDWPGCEGSAPSWWLYWVDEAGHGRRATELAFANPPTLARGSDGRVALLDRCEESTNLVAGVEEPSGWWGEPDQVIPIGWEDAAIREVDWRDGTDTLVLTVTRPNGGGGLDWFELDVDRRSGEVLDSEPVDADAGQVPPATTCSASGLGDVEINSGGPWSGLAAEIQQAALDCDYDRLAELASSDMTYTYGTADGFAGHLLAEEAAGTEPLRLLVRLLETDPGEPAQGSTLSWPAFFSCELTCGMDEAELRRLGYSDVDITGFRDFGGYIGYRVVFEPDGSGGYAWSVFVAGD